MGGANIKKKDSSQLDGNLLKNKVEILGTVDVHEPDLSSFWTPLKPNPHISENQAKKLDRFIKKQSRLVLKSGHQFVWISDKSSFLTSTVHILKLFSATHFHDLGTFSCVFWNLFLLIKGPKHTP